MPQFEKGNTHGKGRKKGSRNKSSIFTEAFDKVYNEELGSGEGAAQFMEEVALQLKNKLTDRSLSTDQLLNLQKALAPYYASKYTSTKSEVTRNDNTVSTKMVKELNEARMEIQKLKGELKESKRKPLGFVDEA